MVVGNCLRSAMAILCLSMAACVSTQYTLVEVGAVPVSSLQVTTNDALWNRAPQAATPFLHSGSEMWTREGPLLDRLLILGGIGNGQALLKSNSEDLVFPFFRSTMLPNEILELTEDSLAKLLGSNSLVSASGLRPTQLEGQRAVMFDLEITASDDPARAGRALAFVSGEELYVILYLATQLHYFDKHWAAAEGVMKSVRVAAESS